MDRQDSYSSKLLHQCIENRIKNSWYISQMPARRRNKEWFTHKWIVLRDYLELGGSSQQKQTFHMVAQWFWGCKRSFCKIIVNIHRGCILFSNIVEILLHIQRVWRSSTLGVTTPIFTPVTGFRFVCPLKTIYQKFSAGILIFRSQNHITLFL